MHWTEDLVAITTGVLILVVSLIVFVVVPYGEINGSEITQLFPTKLTEALGYMTQKIGKWEINPLQAFSGKNYLLGLGSSL